MKDRTLVIYQQSGGIESTFKVIEPINQNPFIASKRMRKQSDTNRHKHEYFRHYDEFYVPRKTHALNVFRSSLAISTAKGIEVMTLEKKTLLSVPDLKDPEVAAIAARIHDLRPLGMFRLSEAEFVLVYDEVAVYINKHGDISRSVVMEFVCKAGQACLVDDIHLILINREGTFVEIRNATNGRLKQVIYGTNIKMLYDGANSNGSSFMIVMQHPNDKRAQLILEMVVDLEYDDNAFGLMPR